MSRKGPLMGMKAVGDACRGILDFVDDCVLFSYNLHGERLSIKGKVHEGEGP